MNTIHISNMTAALVSFCIERRRRTVQGCACLWVVLLLAAGCAYSADPVAPEPYRPAVADEPAELEIRPPTLDEAFNYVMLLGDNVAFLKAKGYKFNLPKHPAFEALLNADAPVGEEQRKELKRIFEEEIYDESTYAPAVEGLEKRRATIEAAIAKLAVLHDNWGLTTFPKHEVVFNFVGLGGGHPLTGKVNMCLREDGTFGGAFGTVDRPEVIVVHELVHNGVDISIAQRFQLSWWEHERLVDLICSEYLGEVLGSPHISQDQGDRRLDEFVTRETITNDLPAAIEKYVAAYPRKEGEATPAWWEKWSW